MCPGRELLRGRQKAWFYLLLSQKWGSNSLSSLLSQGVGFALPPLFTERGDELLSLPATLFIWKQRECVNVCAETFVGGNSGCRELEGQVGGRGGLKEVGEREGAARVTTAGARPRRRWRGEGC